MSWNPIKEAEKAARKAIEKIVNPAVDAGKKAVYDGSKWARDAIRKVQRECEAALKRTGNEIEDGFQKVGDEVEDGLRKTGREIEEGITEKLPDLAEEAIETVLSKATAGAIKKGLDVVLDVVEATSPDTVAVAFGLELAFVVQGEVGVRFDLVNPMSKITEIREWAKNPPSGREGIIACIKDFAPASVSVSAMFSGNGVPAVSWSGVDKLDRLDAFLEKHGVR